MKIVFFSTPAFGHILAEEPIIRALVQSGYSVDWYCTERFRHIVEGSGAVYRLYKRDFDSVYRLSEVTEDFYILMKTILDISRECYVDYIEKMKKEQPSLIIYDSMCAFAKNIAESLKIPSVCLCSTVAFNFLTTACTSLAWPTIKLGVTHFLDILKEVRKEKRFRRCYGIGRLSLVDLFVNRGDITLVLSLRDFQPFAWSFPNSFKFVGPTTKDKKCILEQEYDECDIYFSFGSIFTEERDFLLRIRDAQTLKNKKVVVNSGDLKIKSPSRNVRFFNYTDQLSLLKQTKLFVNHGGMNSIYDSVYMAVPQICVPIQEEERLMSRIVQKERLGIYVKNFDPEKIESYIRKVEKNSQNVQKYSVAMRNNDGVKNASREIKSLIDSIR